MQFFYVLNYFSCNMYVYEFIDGLKSVKNSGGLIFILTPLRFLTHVMVSVQTFTTYCLNLSKFDPNRIINKKVEKYPVLRVVAL